MDITNRYVRPDPVLPLLWHRLNRFIDLSRLCLLRPRKMLVRSQISTGSEVCTRLKLMSLSGCYAEENVSAPRPERHPSAWQAGSAFLKPSHRTDSEAMRMSQRPSITSQMSLAINPLPDRVQNRGEEGWRQLVQWACRWVTLVMLVHHLA